MTNYWHSNKERPENGSSVLWKANFFSKELGNIEGGRYDWCYDCFCGTASLFVNRSNVKKWIYCKDVFNVLDQNERLQAELDREIKKNRKLVKALKEYADKSNWSDYFGDCDGMFWDCGDKGFETAQQTLKEIEEV